MRRMAIQAAYVAGLVRRAQKVAVFFAILMARQAALHDLRSGNFFEPKDFCRIALAFDVRSSRPMTSFAAFAAGIAALFESSLPVRRLLKILVEVFVTLRAQLRAGEFLRRGAGPHISRFWRGGCLGQYLGKNERDDENQIPQPAVDTVLHHQESAQHIRE